MAIKYFYLNTDKEGYNYFVGNYCGTSERNAVGGVLHDAASGINATATSVAKYTINNLNAANYHNSIDDKGGCEAVIHSNYGAWHTATENGNLNYVGVEIAPSLTGGNFSTQSERDKYYKAFVEGCKLMADYCVYFGFTENDVRFHNEFSSTACPYTMKMYFGSYDKAKSEMRKLIKKYILQVKNNGQPVEEVKTYGKVIQYFDELRFTSPENKGDFLIELTATRGIYTDENITKKDVSRDFKVGERYIGKSIGWRGKYWVHSFVSTNGKTYYVAYKMKV